MAFESRPWKLLTSTLSDYELATHRTPPGDIKPVLFGHLAGQHSDDQLKALMVAYPENEYLPEAKRKQWLVSRWVGLTQAERDSFRAALDAADAPRPEHSIV